MRKIIAALFSVVIIVMTGCKAGEAGDPKLVLSNFFDALVNKDFTTAKKYITKDSEGMFGMMQMGMEKMPDKAQMMQYKQENLEFGNVAINGDVATVPVKDKRSGESVDFTLKKEDGWKVAIDIATLMQMAQQKMKQHGMSGLQNIMGDSTKIMNGGALPNIDSLSPQQMEQARKMLDSIGK